MNYKLLANPLFYFPIGEIFLVLTLALAWINPAVVENIQTGFIASLPLLFAAEFIFGHASVGFCVPIFFEGILRWSMGLFIVLLYSGFFYFLFKTGHTLQMVSFLWITISRVYRSEQNFITNKKTKSDRASLYQYLVFPPFLKTIFLCVCLFLSMVIPLPQLGLNGYSITPVDGLSGYFIEHPESVIFLLILYFSLLPWFEKKLFPTIIKKFD